MVKEMRQAFPERPFRLGRSVAALALHVVNTHGKARCSNGGGPVYQLNPATKPVPVTPQDYAPMGEALARDGVSPRLVCERCLPTRFCVWYAWFRDDAQELDARLADLVFDYLVLVHDEGRAETQAWLAEFVHPDVLASFLRVVALHAPLDRSLSATQAFIRSAVDDPEPYRQAHEEYRALLADGVLEERIPEPIRAGERKWRFLRQRAAARKRKLHTPAA